MDVFCPSSAHAQWEAESGAVSLISSLLGWTLLNVSGLDAERPRRLSPKSLFPSSSLTEITFNSDHQDGLSRSHLWLSSPGCMSDMCEAFIKFLTPGLRADQLHQKLWEGGPPPAPHISFGVFKRLSDSNYQRVRPL